MDAVGEEQAELRRTLQGVEEQLVVGRAPRRGGAGEGVGDGVVGDGVRAERKLRIPRIEAKLRTGHPFPCSAGVVIGPVVIVGPNVRQQVVDEIGHVHPGGHIEVVWAERQILPGGCSERRPSQGVASQRGVARTDHIPERSTPVIGLQEVFVDPFGGIINAAIGAVEEEVHEGAMAGHDTHLITQGPYELILQQRVDGVVHACPQVQGVEFGNRSAGEERIPETPLTVLASEIEPEGVLALRQRRRLVGVNSADVVTACDADSGVYLKPAVVFGANPLHGHRAFPSQPMIQRVARREFHNPRASVEVVGRSDE